MRTYWHCERCGRIGGITYAKDEGVYDVFQRVVTSHGKFSNPCDFNKARVRVSRKPFTVNRSGDGK